VRDYPARRPHGWRSWRLNVPTGGLDFGPRPNRFGTIRKTSPHLANLQPRWTLFVRGDLYRLKAPKDPRGHEQAGARFAVVLQSDDVPLSTWVVAPTSTGRREATFRPEVEINGTKTRVLVEQLTVVDPETRLGEFAGRLDGSEMRAIDVALLALLGLD